MLSKFLRLILFPYDGDILKAAQITPHRVVSNPALRLLGPSISSLLKLAAHVLPRSIHNFHEQTAVSGLRCIDTGHSLPEQTLPLHTQLCRHQPSSDFPQPYRCQPLSDCHEILGSGKALTPYSVKIYFPVLQQHQPLQTIRAMQATVSHDLWPRHAGGSVCEIAQIR